MLRQLIFQATANSTAFIDLPECVSNGKDFQIVAIHSLAPYFLQCQPGSKSLIKANFFR